MDYTCENCKSRNTWDCEDCWGRHCENFELDESTLSEKEQKMLRVWKFYLSLLQENTKICED